MAFTGTGRVGFMKSDGYPPFTWLCREQAGQPPLCLQTMYICLNIS